ncbi:hypothetical protein [Streptomyces sp. NPDC042319]|uniref:hypothetical protein n=1 Tax=Streptomyces sp. NPDC042319 TaxID=3154332 RepID=UPI0033CF6022
MLRPTGQSRPGLDIVRNCRVGYDGSSLVFTERGNTRRSFPVGKSGIVRAVLVDSQAPDVGGRVGPPIPGGWGELLLFDASDAMVVRLRLDHWVPEADRLTVRPTDGERLLARSGAAALLKKAGIPVTTVRERQQVTGPTMRVPNALPKWYAAVRGVAAAIWAVSWLLGLMLKPDAPWLLVLAAAAALAGPAAYMVVRSVSLKQKAGSEGVRVAPAPAQKSGATVRFCTTASVYIEARDLVLVDGVGGERRLARSGAHGVSSLVLRTGHKGGERLGVELAGPDGQVRAALPWQWWFAGSEGEQRWQELKSATGLPVEERALRKGASWPADPVAQADARLMRPLPGPLARSASAFPESTLGGANKWIMAVMAVFSLVGAVSLSSKPSYLITVLTLSVLALCGALLPTLVHHMASWLRLDRPAPGQEPTE